MGYDKIPKKLNKIPEWRIPEDKLLEKKVLEKKPQEKKTLVKKNVYTYEGVLPTPNKNNNKKGKRKGKTPNQEPIWMLNAIEPPTDPAFPPSHLEKDDPRVCTINCMIEGSTFYKTFYDIVSSISIMSTVIYRHLYRDRPLCPTYLQL